MRGKLAGSGRRGGHTLTGPWPPFQQRGCKQATARFTLPAQLIGPTFVLVRTTSRRFMSGSSVRAKWHGNHFGKTDLHVRTSCIVQMVYIRRVGKASNGRAMAQVLHSSCLHFARAPLARCHLLAIFLVYSHL